MRSIENVLSQYAAYHRDPRNIATHLVGIPLIVAAVAALLSRPALDMNGIVLSPALLVGAALAAYYLKLDFLLGVLMSGLLFLALLFGRWCAALPALDWLTVSLGGFAIGWLIQFVGHAWEGRKPAFVDDVRSLAIGPLFVLCEYLFLLGLRPKLRAAIESRVGPARRRARLSDG